MKSILVALVVGVVLTVPAQAADTVWYLFVAGPSTNGDIQVEGAYVTERGCGIAAKQKETRKWTYVRCLELSAEMHVRNSKEGNR